MHIFAKDIVVGRLRISLQL